MDPLSIACNHQEPDPILLNCGAKAGEPCNWWDKATGSTCHIIGKYHAVRIEESGNGEPIPEATVEAVVDEMGLG